MEIQCRLGYQYQGIDNSAGHWQGLLPQKNNTWHFAIIKKKIKLGEKFSSYFFRGGEK